MVVAVVVAVTVVLDVLHYQHNYRCDCSSCHYYCSFFVIVVIISNSFVS